MGSGGRGGKTAGRKGARGSTRSDTRRDLRGGPWRSPPGLLVAADRPVDRISRAPSAAATCDSTIHGVGLRRPDRMAPGELFHMFCRFRDLCELSPILHTFPREWLARTLATF